MSNSILLDKSKELALEVIRLCKECLKVNIGWNFFRKVAILTTEQFWNIA